MAYNRRRFTAVLLLPHWSSFSWHYHESTDDIADVDVHIIDISASPVSQAALLVIENGVCPVPADLERPNHRRRTALSLSHSISALAAAVGAVNF